jgi:hypothetical protein
VPHPPGGKADAERMRAAGHTLASIAKRLGVTIGSVTYWLYGEKKREAMKKYNATHAKPVGVDPLFECGSCEKYHAIGDCMAPRPTCRCGLSLPCDDCIPANAASFASERMVRHSF